jgi:hypothetical protein
LLGSLILNVDEFGRVVLLGPQISNAPSIAVVCQFVDPFSKLPFCRVPTVPQAAVRTTAFPKDANQNENPDNKKTNTAKNIFVFTLPKKLRSDRFIKIIGCVYLCDLRTEITSDITNLIYS